MANLLKMFQQPENQKQFQLETKVEVLDHGNLEALKAGITDPAKQKEYMENLYKSKGQGDQQADQEKQPEEEKEKPKIKSLGLPAPKRGECRATLFMQPRRSISSDESEDYDSEEEEEKEVLAEIEMAQTQAKAPANEEAKSVEIKKAEQEVIDEEPDTPGTP